MKHLKNQDWMALALVLAFAVYAFIRIFRGGEWMMPLAMSFLIFDVYLSDLRDQSLRLEIELLKTHFNHSSPWQKHYEKH